MKAVAVPLATLWKAPREGTPSDASFRCASIASATSDPVAISTHAGRPSGASASTYPPRRTHQRSAAGRREGTNVVGRSFYEPALPRRLLGTREGHDLLLSGDPIGTDFEFQRAFASRIAAQRFWSECRGPRTWLATRSLTTTRRSR